MKESTNTYVDLIINSYLSFDRLITLRYNDFVVVKFNFFTHREYFNSGVNQLINTLLSFENKIFIFIIDDGVDFRFSGLKCIIEHIVDTLHLDESNCYIYSWENLSIPNTTFILQDVVKTWCHSVYHGTTLIPPNENDLTKKFAALYGRHSVYRLKIMKHLHENYKNTSILSYCSGEKFWEYFENSAEFYTEDINWYKNNCPILLDFETSSAWVPYQKGLDCIHKHYNCYFVEIVCETDPYSIFFTEKTIKNFYIGKPFILLSGAGSLEYLKNRGFQTFSNWIDESYDSMPNVNHRLTHIKKEIDRIAKFSLSELTQMQNEMKEVHELNRERFLEICLTS